MYYVFIFIQDMLLLFKHACLISKNSGMTFKQSHPNEFHTYGMNSVSMTFILSAVRSS